MNGNQLPPIDVGYAQYVGSRNGAGVNEWLGVRYAAAPVGDLRFRAPQDPPNITDTTQIANRVCRRYCSCPLLLKTLTYSQ